MEKCVWWQPKGRLPNFEFLIMKKEKPRWKIHRGFLFCANCELNITCCGNGNAHFLWHTHPILHAP